MIQIGDKVLHQIGPKNWKPAKVIQMVNPASSVVIQDNRGKCYRRNTINIRQTSASVPEDNCVVPEVFGNPVVITENVSSNFDMSKRDDGPIPVDVSSNVSTHINDGSIRFQTPNNVHQTTRSGRIVHPPRKLDL